MLASQRHLFRQAANTVVRPTRFDAARQFERLGLAAFGMAFLTLGMYGLDDRSLGGELVWLKPFKFAVSFVVLFATLAWAARRLSNHWRTSWMLVVGVVASGAAFFFEMAYIGA